MFLLLGISGNAEAALCGNGVVRDFLHSGTAAPGPGHPDFQTSAPAGAALGMVNPRLGLNGKPVGMSQISSPTNFCWWYSETGCGGAESTNPYARRVDRDRAGNPTTLTLPQTSPDVYAFSSAQFFPVDGLGWNAGASPQQDNDCRGTGGTAWQNIPGKLLNVSVAADGTVWGVSRTGAISRWINSVWTLIPGALRWISVGSATNVWGVSSAGLVSKFNPATNGWDTVSVPSGTFKGVSTAAAGTTLLLRSDGTLRKK